MFSYLSTHLQLVSQCFALSHAHVVEQCLESLVAFLAYTKALILALDILPERVLVESGHKLISKGVTNLSFAFGENALQSCHIVQVYFHQCLFLPIRLNLQIPNAGRQSYQNSFRIYSVVLVYR